MHDNLGLAQLSDWARNRPAEAFFHTALQWRSFSSLETYPTWWCLRWLILQSKAWRPAKSDAHLAWPMLVDFVPVLPSQPIGRTTDSRLWQKITSEKARSPGETAGSLQIVAQFKNMQTSNQVSNSREPKYVSTTKRLCKKFSMHPLYIKEKFGSMLQILLEKQSAYPTVDILSSRLVASYHIVQMANPSSWSNTSMIEDTW